MNYKKLNTDELLNLLGPKRYKIHPDTIKIIEEELISRGEKIPSDEDLIFLANNNNEPISKKKTSTKILYGIVALVFVLNASGYFLFIGLPLSVILSVLVIVIIKINEKSWKKALISGFMSFIISISPLFIWMVIMSLIS